MNNDFTEAAYNSNSIEELRDALDSGPDSADMATWCITEDEWLESVTEAYQTQLAESDGRAIADRFSDTSELMEHLDANVYPSDQDWDAGETRWTMDDGSIVVVSGNDVEIV